MRTNTVEVAGTLHADGQLVLDEKPALPAGRVRVALQALSGASRATERLPDAPSLDESTSAPFDLPHEGVVEQIQPRALVERLPQKPGDSAE